MFIMESCGMSCIKYLLFIFNSIFALSGIALIVTGGCVLHDVERFKAFLEGSLLAPPIVLIIIGIIVFVVAFVGCCGAIKESPGMLMVFGGLLFMIFVTEIAVGILSAVRTEAFHQELWKSMKTSVDNYDPTIKEDRQLWAEIQSNLECCGVDGPSDWKLGGQYPASCCKGYNSDSRDELCNPSHGLVHQIGCFQKLKETMIKESHVILGVGIGIALLQFTGIILACMLASAIRREWREDRMRYY